MRCIAITKGWTRCRNHAETGKFFCYTHKGWLWGATIPAIGFVVALCAGLSQIFGATLPNPLATDTPHPTFTGTADLTNTTVLATETLTYTLAFAPTFTETWTPSPFPSQTPTLTKTSTPIHTPTTALALENYGGLDRNCIPDLYWDFATSESIQLENGCLQLQKWGFYADKQAIIIKQPSPKVQAGDLEINLYYPLADRFEPPFDIFFKVYIESFGGSESSTVSPLFSIGICDPVNWQSSFKMVSFSSQSDSIQRGILVDQQKTWYRNFEVLGIMETKSYSLAIEPFRVAIFEDAHYVMHPRWANGCGAQPLPPMNEALSVSNTGCQSMGNLLLQSAI